MNQLKGYIKSGEIFEYIANKTKLINDGVADPAKFVKEQLQYYYNIIPYEQEFRNIEDTESRLYYEETKTQGGFELGLEGEVTIYTRDLPFERLPLPQWTINKIKDVVTAEINVVAKAASSAAVKVGIEERKYVESTKKSCKKWC